MRWAVLVPPSQRPPVLNRRHDDYPWPFKWVPRAWAAFLSDVPPTQLEGTNPKDHHTDIPAPGTWSLTWPPHFSVTTKGGWLLHFGLRYDYLDFYYNADFALKKYRMEENTA